VAAIITITITTIPIVAALLNACFALDLVESTEWRLSPQLNKIATIARSNIDFRMAATKVSFDCFEENSYYACSYSRIANS